ncbi:MAG: HpcH/HpaI aldolase/citrate lyase family protein [Dermatophilus congolensis]|nr:HpcH/HpaI aldolase/citrate lyase family protein [Dermatophilus congolensis]
MPRNTFRRRLTEGQKLFGLWLVLGDSYSAELLAGVGYDWLLIDAEHGPNDLRSVLSQLQSIAAANALAFDETERRTSEPVVRLPNADASLIKQYLEIGAPNLLLPMIDTPEDAQAVIQATRYAPAGVRGMGSGIGRSSRWGRLTDYVGAAGENIGVIVQVETRTALENAEAIASVDGVDGVLFGASDLSAELGVPGQPNHPDVVAAITEANQAVLSTGTPTGIMVADPLVTERWMSQGVTFAGVAADSSLLVKAADALLERFRSPHE